MAAGFISLLALGMCFHLSVLTTALLGLILWNLLTVKFHTVGEMEDTKKAPNAGSSAFHSQSKYSQKVIIGSSGFLNLSRIRYVFYLFSFIKL